MDTTNVAHNVVVTNGTKLTLNHIESETSLGPDNEFDSFYEFPHNHFEQTKRETEKRYFNGPCMK